MIAGAGGDAESDEVGVIVTDRTGDGSLRGTLIAGNINGTVNSTGGNGSTLGVGLMEGGSSFVVENGDATLGSLDFTINADGQIADLATDSISIVNGTVLVDGSFSFSTAGVASIRADSGTLTAQAFNVSADNFVHDPDRPFPAAVGTISADTFDLSTNGDLIIDAHLISTASLNLSAPGLIDIEDATSGSDLTLDAGSSISGGSMTAAGLIDANATGDIGLNLVIAGTTITMQSTAGSIFANGLSAGGLVDLHANVDVSTGDIAGDSINILADTGGISVGDLIAQTSVDLNAQGAISISGGVSTGLFQAAAGTNLTTQAITAQTIDASAGGTATINGIWSAQDVTLASNDIDISGTGGISGSGLVTLISTNATQALIGDGLTGSGYALSNAEFGRIEGGSVHILARGDASAAQDMLIGDLTVTGPTAGSTIEDSDGILVFATGDLATQSSGGVIRVVGDVAATGFGSGNAMEFHAGTFELDAATGSISITSSGTTLGGELGLYADQIHVASGAILDQLADDPQYEGYQDDLNAPAAVQRPEGVLSAGVDLDRIRQSAEHPDPEHGHRGVAGRLPGQRNLRRRGHRSRRAAGIDRPRSSTARSITEGGTLTGIDGARRAGRGRGPDAVHRQQHDQRLPADRPLRASQPSRPEPPFPPGFTPTPGIQDEVGLIDTTCCRRRCSTMRTSSTTIIALTRRGRDQPDRTAAAAVRHQRAGRRGRCRRSGIGQRQPGADGNAGRRAVGRLRAGKCKQEKQP